VEFVVDKVAGSETGISVVTVVSHVSAFQLLLHTQLVCRKNLMIVAVESVSA
jgi:hypothetical protein